MTIQTYRFARMGMIILFFSTIWTNGLTGEFEVSRDTKRPLVILGASYAGSWGIEKVGGRQVVNMGIDGNQSFEMTARFERDVVAKDPVAVLIWGFINDLYRSDPEKLEDTRARIVSSYRDLISKANESGIKVLLATEVSIREPAGLSNWFAAGVGRLLGRPSYQDSINRHVNEVNDELKKLAEIYDVNIFDFASLLSDTNGKRKRIYAADDGSHLTPEAYEVLSAFAAIKLAPELDDTQTDAN